MIEIENINSKVLTSCNFDDFYCKLNFEEIIYIRDYLYPGLFKDNQKNKNIDRMICCEYITKIFKDMIDNPATTVDDFNRLCAVYTSAIFHK